MHLAAATVRCGLRLRLHRRWSKSRRSFKRDVPVQGEWVGTLEGYVNAQIQPQVSGYLIRQDYHEGAFVKKDQLLFEIDPRPFQAVLDQAKGQLAQAEAQMANAETEREA